MQEAPPNLQGGKDLGSIATVAIGVYLVALAIVLSYGVIVLWPAQDAGGSECSTTVVLLGAARFGWKAEFTLPLEVRLILLVMAVGALGSYVHAATSFATYVGNRRLIASWVWWYFLRPFVGMTLALVVYFAVRGGLLTGATGNNLNAFGICAIAALTGMFSKQATDKLRELFDNLFKTERADERADKLQNPSPHLTTVVPGTLTVGQADLGIRVAGSGFVHVSVVRINGTDRQTQFLSETELHAQLVAADVTAAGTLQVTVSNPAPGGGTSNPTTITVH